MKRFLLFFLLGGISVILFSQIIPADDPNMSINWDWTKSQEPYIYFKDFTNGQIQSPLTNVYLPFYSSSTPLNSSGDPQKADMHPEDGWMLVCRDFGTPQRAPYVPFFALYNKYTGTLRVMFLNTVGLIGMNGYSNFKAQLEWMHKDATGAIMTFSPTEECFVNEYNNEHNEFSMSSVENTPESWGYADFHLTGYEPSYSKIENAFLKINLIAVDISNITLNSTEFTLNQVLPKDENVSGSILDNIASGNSGNLGKSLSQASKYYKATEKGKKELAKWVDYDYITGEIPETYKLQYQEDFWEEYYLKDNNFEKKDWYQTAATWLIDNLGKELPYVGGVIGFVTSYFGGKDKTAAQEPINFSGTLNFEGTIEHTDDITNIAIALTPFNEYTEQQAYWPVQNIPWGIYNIMDKPIVDFGYYMYEMINSHGYPSMVEFVRLKNDLKFVFNDNCGLELIDMKVSYTYKDRASTTYFNPIIFKGLSIAATNYPGGRYSEFIPTGIGVHLEFRVKADNLVNSPKIYQFDKVYPFTLNDIGDQGYFNWEEPSQRPFIYYTSITFH